MINISKKNVVIVGLLLFTFCCQIFAVENHEAFRGSDYYCRRAIKPISIDGDSSDWQQQLSLPLLLVCPKENINVTGWQGLEDVSAVCYFLWDEDCLYFLAEVYDDVHTLTAAGHDMYYRNSFQLAFDPLDNTLLPGYDGDDIEIGIGDLGDSVAAYCWVAGMTGLSGDLAKDIVNAVYKPWDNGKGGTYEAAISWKMLYPFTPEVSSHFGFNITYNENDDTGYTRKGWLMWTPGIAEEKMAWLFKNIRLAEQSEASFEPAISFDRKYYNRGSDVEIYGYYFLDGLEQKQAQASLLIKNSEGVLYRTDKNVEIISGLNRFDFNYSLPQTATGKYDCILTVKYDDADTEIEANSELLIVEVGMLREYTKKVAKLNDELKGYIANGQRQGVDMAYPLVTASNIDVFLKYRLKELSDEKLIKEIQPLDAFLSQFEFLAQSAKSAIKEAKGLIANPKSAKSVPNIEMRDIVIKKGSFYKDDEPVMLFGPMGWWRIFEDLEQISGMGFNYVSSTLTPKTVVPSPGEIKYNYLRSMARHFDNAAEHNLAVDFLPGPHFMPEGWVKKFPDILDYRANGWIRATLYDPNVRRMIEEYWGALIPYLCDKPALVSWDLANEWEFTDGKDKIHPRMLTFFHNHLRDKYNDINGVNNSWSSSYEDFDGINPLDFDKIDDIAAYYDWAAFRNSEATEVIQFLMGIVRRYDAKTLCHIKIIATTDLTPEHYGSNGIERETIGDLLEISGCDVGLPMHFDFYKSLHPAKPSVDSEVHVSVHTTPQEMRATTWAAFLHGQSARLLFAWLDSHETVITAAGALLHVPWTMEAAGRTSLDIRRLAKEVTLFQQAIPQAEVAILFSQPSIIIDDSYAPVLRSVYNNLYFLDTQIRFVSERQINEGLLKDIKLLVIPNANYVDDLTYSKIEEYAKDGGKILAVGQCLDYNPYGKNRKNNLLKHGLESYEKVDDNFHDFVDKLIDKIDADRQIRPVDSSGNNLVNVEFRMVKDKSDILAYMINYRDEDVYLNFDTDLNIESIYNLIENESISLPFRLPVREPVMFRIKTN